MNQEAAYDPDADPADAASLARGSLVYVWRALYGKNTQKLIAWLAKKEPKEVRQQVDAWLRARNLEHIVTYSHTEEQYLYYRVRQNQVKAGHKWELAYHGTWWYAARALLEGGVLVESNNHALGHQFRTAGVYVSPIWETARIFAELLVLAAILCLLVVFAGACMSRGQD